MYSYNFGWLADRLLCFTNAALVHKIVPYKSRKNVGKIEVLTDTPTEFELGDTAAVIQRRREEREQREV